MKVKEDSRKKFIDCHNGKCAKDVVVIKHNDVMYTVVYDKPLCKNDHKLRVYWNDDQWGHSHEVTHPFNFDDSDVSQVAHHAKVLGDAQ